MKFLFFGGNGWIGQQVIELLSKDAHTVVKSSCRADDDAAVIAKELKEVNPDRVISIIGRTRSKEAGGCLTVDYLEQKGKLKENMNDNLFAILNIAHCCKVHGVHLTSMGTGCIFTSAPNDLHELSKCLEADDEAAAKTKCQMFTEDDKPNFFGSGYSTVKGYTDRLLQTLFDDSVLNVRIRMPISPDDNPFNFLTKIINYKKVVNIPNSVTVLPLMLPKLVDMSIKKVTGTINLTQKGVISHNECLELYKQIVQPSYTFENFSMEEQNKILMSERSNNCLDTTKLCSMYDDIDDAHTAMKKVLTEMKKNFPQGISKK